MSNKAKLNMPAWAAYTISAVIVCISAVMIVTGFGHRKTSAEIKAHCSEKAEGVMIEEKYKRRTTSRGSSSVRSSYTVQLEGGTPLGETLITGYGSNQYDVGDSVTVFYDPENADPEDETTWYLEKCPPDNGVLYFVSGGQGIIIAVLLFIGKLGEERERKFEDRMRSYPQES